MRDSISRSVLGRSYKNSSKSFVPKNKVRVWSKIEMLWSMI